MKNKVIKVVFNDDVTQEEVDSVSEMISFFLAYVDVTAAQIVGDEDCEDDEPGDCVPV